MHKKFKLKRIWKSDNTDKDRRLKPKDKGKERIQNKHLIRREIEEYRNGQ